MPLDGTHFDTEIDLTELQPGEEGLWQLSYLLRHPEKWPEGHVWDFYTLHELTPCGTIGCALGLASSRWGHPARQEAWETWGAATYVFGRNFYKCPASQVTPTMVAAAIDFFLATGRVPAGGEAAVA